MGRKLFFLVVLFLLIQRPASADSWTSRDKLNHFAFSAVIASAAAKSHGPMTGAAIGLVPGVVKELADMGGAGTPSMKDMAWNAVGAMTGALLPSGFLVVPTTNQSGLFFTYRGSF
jgi:uncharacterized protein YfiM (DUF2279 family)